MLISELISIQPRDVLMKTVLIIIYNIPLKIPVILIRKLNDGTEEGLRKNYIFYPFTD